MPIYEYGCNKCEEIKEVVQSVKEMEAIKEGILSCIDLICCNKEMQLLISRTSFQFGNGDGASFEDKYCHSGTGYSRSMPEMVKYMQEQYPEKMDTKQKHVRDYKSDKILSFPK